MLIQLMSPNVMYAGDIFLCGWGCPWLMIIPPLHPKYSNYKSVIVLRLYRDGTKPRPSFMINKESSNWSLYYLLIEFYMSVDGSRKIEKRNSFSLYCVLFASRKQILQHNPLQNIFKRSISIIFNFVGCICLWACIHTWISYWR